VKTLLLLRITPNARKSEVIGWHNEAIKIKIQAPPVEGKANAAVLRFLAEQLEVAAGDLHLCGGGKSRDKRVEVHGLDLAQICEKLKLPPQ